MRKISKEFINNKVISEIIENYEPEKRTYEGSFVFEKYTFEWEVELKGSSLLIQKKWYGKKGERELEFAPIMLSNRSKTLQYKFDKFLETYSKELYESEQEEKHFNILKEKLI